MKEISLFIMTQKGYEVLQHVFEAEPNLIEMIVIGKDSRVENDYSYEISEFCKNKGIKYFYMGEEPKVCQKCYIIAISWRWMINHPTNKLIIFHDSLLPKYRGFAPLVNMLINGEKEIGVSAIFGASEYDRGEIIAQKSTKISYPLKISQAITINNRNFLELVQRVVRNIANSNEIKSTPQVESEATYSIWRDFDDYFIDWNVDAQQIKRLIDAVGYPYLGAKTQTSNKDIVVIEEGEVVEDVYCELRHIGKVIFVNDGFPTVICGTGLLRIKTAFTISDDGPKDFLPMKGFRVRFHSETQRKI